MRGSNSSSARFIKKKTTPSKKHFFKICWCARKLPRRTLLSWNKVFVVSCVLLLCGMHCWRDWMYLSIDSLAKRGQFYSAGAKCSAWCCVLCLCVLSLYCHQHPQNASSSIHLFFYLCIVVHARSHLRDLLCEIVCGWLSSEFSVRITLVLCVCPMYISLSSEFVLRCNCMTATDTFIGCRIEWEAFAWSLTVSSIKSQKFCRQQSRWGNGYAVLCDPRPNPSHHQLVQRNMMQPTAAHKSLDIQHSDTSKVSLLHRSYLSFLVVHFPLFCVAIVQSVRRSRHCGREHQQDG